MKPDAAAPIKTITLSNPASHHRNSSHPHRPPAHLGLALLLLCRVVAAAASLCSSSSIRHQQRAASSECIHDSTGA